jgi:tetratricopeptide (TPR) repeat protein
MTQPAEAQLLEIGLRHHRAGQLAQAENVYGQILARDPGHGDALHLLGIIASETRRPGLAVELMRRAVSANPAVAGFHNDLGNALRGAGRTEEAIAAYRQAIAIDPAFALAHYSLGDSLLDRGAAGDLEEIVAANLTAIRLKADYAQAFNNISIARRRQGKHDDAIAASRKAIAIKPDYYRAYNSLGIALKEQGDVQNAVAAYRECLQLNPDFVDALNNLGIALAESGHGEEAICLYQRAIQLRPDYAKAHHNLGCALAGLGQLEAALAAYRKAIDLQPGFAEAVSNMGLALSGICQFDEAIAAFDRAIELRPDFAEAHVNRAMALLVRGDFERGLPEYQWRLQVRLLSKDPSSRIAQTQWSGGSLEGRTIFLHAEQGFGDTLQFVRFVPLVIERGGRVILGCHPQLARLLRNVPGIERIVTIDEAMPDFDLHCPLASLPLAFGTRLNSIPAQVPYLKASSDRVENWSRRLGPRDGRLRVGLAWAGNPKFKGDLTRSTHLSQLAPLAEVPGVRFYSLQKGPAGSQAAAPPPGMELIDLGPELEDFADTAAVMSLLDLVVSTDTSVPHLAGALGRPVWVMLQYSPDWRWLLDREDSPWYPTMRLFRQKSLGDWAGVVQHVAGDLRKREA